MSQAGKGCFRRNQSQGNCRQEQRERDHVVAIPAPYEERQPADEQGEYQGLIKGQRGFPGCGYSSDRSFSDRSEEHTFELQSRGHLVCRLLLEKKNKAKI